MSLSGLEPPSLHLMLNSDNPYYLLINCERALVYSVHSYNNVKSS